MTRNSKRDRRACFDSHSRVDHLGRTVMDCHICKGRYGVIVPAMEDWEAEHVIPDAFDGKDIRPAHVHCHLGKTRKDLKDIAKVRHTRDRTFGIKRSGGSMAGSRRSKHKRKMDGTTVLRDEDT